MKTNIIFRIVLVTTLLMIGCSSSNNSDSGDSNSNAQSSISEIAGFWDTSEGIDNIDNEEQDVFYSLISPDGIVTQYDYDQDEAGGGRDCYYRSTENADCAGQQSVPAKRFH